MLRFHRILLDAVQRPAAHGRLEADRRRPAAGLGLTPRDPVVGDGRSDRHAGGGGEDPPAAGAPARRIPQLEAEIDVDGDARRAGLGDAWSSSSATRSTPGENTAGAGAHRGAGDPRPTTSTSPSARYDPDPSAIRAHLTDRDAAWADDWVGVVLDTFNDERRDYLLLVNPLGVQMDAHRELTRRRDGWDGIWESAAADQPTGAGRPRSRSRSRRCSFQRSAEPQVWGFDAVRGYPRDTFRPDGRLPPRPQQQLLPLPGAQDHRLRGRDPGRNLEVEPTLTASRTESATSSRTARSWRVTPRPSSGSPPAGG